MISFYVIDTTGKNTPDKHCSASHQLQFQNLSGSQEFCLVYSAPFLIHSSFRFFKPRRKYLKSIFWTADHNLPVNLVYLKELLEHKTFYRHQTYRNGVLCRRKWASRIKFDVKLGIISISTHIRYIIQRNTTHTTDAQIEEELGLISNPVIHHRE